MHCLWYYGKRIVWWIRSLQFSLNMTVLKVFCELVLVKGNYFQEWKINGFVNLEEIWSHWMEFRKSSGMCINFLTQNILIWSVLCADVKEYICSLCRRERHTCIDSCNTREVPDLFFVQTWETPATIEKSFLYQLCVRSRLI